MQANKLIAICPLEALQKVSYLSRPIVFKKQPCSALVFCFDGQVYSYVNHCMHMHRPLNGEQDAIFDDSGRYLRCSMHGFVFEPTTGECQSPVCLGQHLQTLRLQVVDGIVYFAEKHLQLPDCP